MASIEKLANSRSGSKPTIKATVVVEDKHIVVRIPRTVNATDIRENVNEEKGKTSFGLVAIATDAKGLALEPFAVTIAEGDHTAKGKFSLGSMNLLFRGMEAA